MATRARRTSKSRRSSRSRKGKSRFVDLPNYQKIRRRSPESAPRLFEWLVDNGYIEPVSMYKRKSVARRNGANRRTRRR